MPPSVTPLPSQKYPNNNKPKEDAYSSLYAPTLGSFIQKLRPPPP